jgi:TonB-dependent SusC/RagA subfamily outer membrane receptor
MRKVLALLLGAVLFSIQLYAQSRVVTGKITDDRNVPVANASITVKGGTIGTTSNEQGDFSLTVPANATALIVSSIGYSPYEISITNRNSVTVVLSQNQQSMDEVVVVAYGTVKREALTGSVGTIKAADIENRPIANITRALEGNVPGLVTTAGNGQPGSGSAIRIRGFGSINATSEPLLVVDGVPYVGGTGNIDPNDVESITVLKDASSTALYGSRAANGVVMITTRKGQKGRNNITVRAQQGVVTRGLAEYDRLNAYQYYPILWEAYRNSLVTPVSGTGISVDSANRVASGLTTRTSIFTDYLLIIHLMFQIMQLLV